MSDKPTSPGPWHIHVNAADDLEVNTADGRTVVKWYASENCNAPGDPALIASAPTLRDQRDRAVAHARKLVALWDSGDITGHDICTQEALEEMSAAFVGLRALLAEVDEEITPAAPAHDPFADGYSVIEASIDGETWIEIGERVPIAQLLPLPPYEHVVAYRYWRTKAVRRSAGAAEVVVRGMANATVDTP